MGGTKPLETLRGATFWPDSCSQSVARIEGTVCDPEVATSTRPDKTGQGYQVVASLGAVCWLAVSASYKCILPSSLASVKDPGDVG